MSATSEPPAGAEQPATRRPRRPLGWLITAAVLALLLLLAVFGPQWFGQLLLARLGGAYHLGAQSVGGPIWAPTLNGLTVSGPGVQVQAGTVSLSLGGLSPSSARVNVRLADATVAVKLKALLGGQKGGGRSSFSLLPGTLDVRNTHLVLDGRGIDVPSGRWTANTVPVVSGTALKIEGATDNGPLSALLRYDVQQGELRGSADIQADARILNFYWHDHALGGVRSGQISGRYTFGGGPISGDLTLKNAALAVPRVSFVTVGNIGGTVTHRGTLITLRLAGQGFQGPVTAGGTVDLAKHRWDLRASARPQVAALGRALGQAGRGVATVSVHAYGWNTVTVKADVRSPDGQFSVLPYRNLRATYLLQRGKTLQHNDLAFSADTRFQGRQRLSGQWTFNKAGQFAWDGTLLSKPLAIKGSVDARNVLTAQGQALGGPFSGSLGLRDKAVTLAASPKLYSVSGDLTAQGTLSALALTVRGGHAGPVALSGTGRYSAAGLSADLGPIQLRLDRQLRGTWRATAVPVSGVSISGSGLLRVPETNVSGRLSAAVPLLSTVPSGPFALNWQKRQADWRFAGGAVSWRGDTFALHSQNLAALGYTLRGDVALSTALRASGTLTASGRGGTLTVRGLGAEVALTAVQGGVQVEAQTRLAPGFPTTARLSGTEVSGSVSVDNGVRFTLNTAGKTAQGRLDMSGQQRWDASGTLDLSALRPLLGGGLKGTAQLNLRGQGGTVTLRGVQYAANGTQATLNGTLSRRGTSLTADAALTASVQGQRVSAGLRGRVFPDVKVSGPLTVQGTYGTQRVQASVRGAYPALQARVDGTLGALSVGGVTLPAGQLALTGTLTPSLSAAGRYGDLKLAYAGGTLSVQGTQALTALGQNGSFRVNGRYGPGWAGRLALSGQLGGYALSATGPWQALNTVLTSREGLRAACTVNARTLGYDLTVGGTVAGLGVQGRVRGVGARPTGTLTVTNPGGRARVTLNGLTDFQVQAAGLTLGGQTLNGQLSAVNGQLSGTLTAGPLSLVARNGQVQASGTLYGHSLQASGRVTLPSTLSGVTLTVSGPLLDARLTGSGADLRGSVQLHAQTYLPTTSGPLVRVPAQLLPLRASVTPLLVNVGGLTYANGRWGGTARLRYALALQPGSVVLAGGGSTLTARPTGPLTGQLQVLPTLGGTLSASLSPLLPLLPAQLAGTVVPGRVVAVVQPAGAALSLQGSRYLGEPLHAAAQVRWAGGLTASATLAHPGSRIPLRYDGHTLSVAGAVLDARALRPFTGTLALTGRVGADVTLPGLRLERGQGRVTLDVQAGTLQSGLERAQGALTLENGTLSADLSSTLGGQNVRVQGPLYPAADARLSLKGTLGELGARLSGDVRTQASLDVTGVLSGRAVQVRAVGGLSPAQGPAQVRVQGEVAGLVLDVRADRPAGVWTLGGGASAGDTTALTGTAGTLNAVLSGTLSDVRLSASGVLGGGARLTVPARFAGGVLSVNGAVVRVPNLAEVRVSGPVYPKPALVGSAAVQAYLPGTYTLRAGGSLGKPDVRVQGRVGGGSVGLDAAGTVLSAHLLGQDYRLSASGPRLSGNVRGRLGSTLGPAGLVSADLRVDAAYRTGTQRFSLRGRSGWSQAAGFLGDLSVAGQLSGKPLSLRARGNGPLQVDATLGQVLGPQAANLSAVFPASLPLRPGGKLTLRGLDLGAVWGRPDQLSVSAGATLSGASWGQLTASLQGQLVDAAGELSGALNGTAQFGTAGRYALSLTGPRVTAAARLQDGGYTAQLGSSGAELARLLPPSAGVGALTFSGETAVTGRLDRGVRQLTLSRVALRGEQTQVGPFTLTGSAAYPPTTAQADLSGTVLGGTVRVQGALPSNMQVTLGGLRPTAFGLDTLDGTLNVSGPLAGPFVSGRLNVTRPELTASVDASGPLTDPLLNLAATLRGQASGRVLAQVRRLRLSPLSADVHVYGAAGVKGARVNLDLNGAWPQLAGTAAIQVPGVPDTLSLNGDGHGTYTLEAGRLGTGRVQLSGFVPTVSALLHLTPLPLIGGQGDASADVSVGGPLGGLSLSAAASVPGASVGPLRLAGLQLALSGPLTGKGAGLGTLTGSVRQDTRPVGTLKNGAVTFDTLTLSASGFTAAASGRATLSGTGRAALNISGPGTTAQLNAAYAGGSFALGGTASASGVRVRLDSTGSLRNGWSGTLALDGGPSGVLTAPGRFTVKGPVLQPLLAGSLGIEGAGVRLVANRQNVQLRLIDGPVAQASGVLNLDLDRQLWSGQAHYQRPEAALDVALSGAAGAPQAVVSVRRGGWTARGTVSAGGADLTVDDGRSPAPGRVRWDGRTLSVDATGLTLDTLNLPPLRGRLSASGSVQTGTLDGALSLKVSGLNTGYTLPVVNLPLNGDVSAAVRVKGGAVSGSAQVQAGIGTVALQLAQATKGGPYTGTVSARLKQPAVPAKGTAAARSGGTLNADLTLDAAGLRGQVVSSNLNVNLGGLNARLNGTAALTGASFTVQADAASGSGSGAQVSVSGSGGLADLLPSVTALTGVKPTGDGYSLRATLSALEVQGLKVAPNLSGAVSGEAVISDGGGTFVLRSAALNVGGTVLSTRLDGTLVGDGPLFGRGSLLNSDWRIRGVVGNGTAATSQLTGSLSAGVLSGTFQLRGLPVDALLSAFSGRLPGRGQLTGLARFRLPVSDPLAGDVNVVADRLTVSSTGPGAAEGAPGSTAPTPGSAVQTLSGSGYLRYANRELLGVDLHLQGAGRWDVTGQYTRRAVGVTASFQNTTFSPVLLLIPSLRDQSPSLQGTLSLSVGGTYDRPVGSVNGSNLQGALGGLSVRVPSLSGQLPDTGIISAQASLQSGGTLGSDGTLQVSGQLSSLKLSGFQVQYRGVLTPSSLGRIENVQATLGQDAAGGFSVRAQAVGGVGVGRLDLSGSVSPLINLKLTARNFNLPLSVIYGQQDRLNADLTAVEVGPAGSNSPINVSGAVNVQSLLLGRGQTAAVIPAPASAGAAAGSSAQSAAAASYQSPLPEALTTFPKAQTATAAPVSPLLSRLVFQNIAITAPSGIRVDESIARAELGGNLVLAGSGSAPTLSGEVRAIRGSVDLRDNSFTIDSGSATFAGTSLYPVLSVSATGDVPLPQGGQVGVNLSLDGKFAVQQDGSTALALDTRLSCVRGCVSAGLDLSAANPNAEAELYSLVAVGTPDLASLPSTLGTLGTSALKTALNLFVLGEVQRNIARALGVDVFRINAALPGENGSTTFGATFTVGSYLTRQLYLQYQVDLTGLGLLDATYTTPDNLFTFKASTPIQGLDLSTLQPSFSVAYNLTNRSSVQLGVQSGVSTKLNFGYVYRW